MGGAIQFLGEPGELAHGAGVLDDDGNFAAGVEAGPGQGDAADDGAFVINQHEFAVGGVAWNGIAAVDADVDAAGAGGEKLFEHLAVLHLVIDEDNALAGVADEFLEAPAGGIGAGDEAFGQVLTEWRGGLFDVVAEEAIESVDDGGILGEQHEVAGLLKALGGEVQGSDHGVFAVNQQVLGVVLDVGEGVAVDVGAHAFKKDAEFPDAFFPTLCPLREEEVHLDAAFEGVGEFVHHLEIGAAEHGERHTGAGAADERGDGIAPVAGAQDQRFRGGQSFLSFAWSQLTLLRPASPLFINCP